MRRIVFGLILVLLLVPAYGSIDFRICETDGITPYDGRDLMVGERLVFMFRSDNTDYSSCGIFVSGATRDLGKVIGRDSDPTTVDCEQSHFVNSGLTAKVINWEDSQRVGCDLYGSAIESAPGDWFVVDYEALGVGLAEIIFYDYSYDWDSAKTTVTINQVRTRDLNADTHVNSYDFLTMSDYWEVTGCNDPNGCGMCDFDNDTDIDIDDMVLFWDYWLAGEGKKTPVDETVRYKVVDEAGNNIISLDYGQSVRLYVDLEYTDVNDIGIFQVEVLMDDVLKGTIDNRSHDPNDPNNFTAEVLASPAIFTAWQAGEIQSEGIEFFAANLGSKIDAGHLASFIYTCDSTEKQRLYLINKSSSTSDGDMIYPATEDLIINPVIQTDNYSMSVSQTAPAQATFNSTESMATQDAVLFSTDSVQSVGDTQMSVDEMAEFLENIYEDSEEIQNEFSKDEWEEFVADVVIQWNEQIQ